MNRPHSLQPEELARVGFELLDDGLAHVRCARADCRTSWVLRLAHGRLPRGEWWVCPNGCNRETGSAWARSRGSSAYWARMSREERSAEAKRRRIEKPKMTVPGASTSHSESFPKNFWAYRWLEGDSYNGMTRERPMRSLSFNRQHRSNPATFIK